MPQSRHVVIIGSGPAGLTAAIYTARANLAPLVIEGEPSSTTDQPGGQLMLTTEVENFPGFVDGIQGPELMGSFRAQAARFGAEFLTEKVSRVDFDQLPFKLWVGDPAADEPTYTADAVIVSTGARPGPASASVGRRPAARPQEQPGDGEERADQEVGGPHLTGEVGVDEAHRGDGEEHERHDAEHRGQQAVHDAPDDALDGLGGLRPDRPDEALDGVGGLRRPVVAQQARDPGGPGCGRGRGDLGHGAEPTLAPRAATPPVSPGRAPGR